MSRREAGGVRRTRPETIPGPGRQTGRLASCISIPAGIVGRPAQLRFPRRNVTAELGCEGNQRAPPTDFFFLGAAANGVTESTVRRLQKPRMKPIILQVPNRDSNSVKMIRPVQGTFSGLQHPPDSDRFTLFLRRLGCASPYVHQAPDRSHSDDLLTHPQSAPYQGNRQHPGLALEGSANKPSAWL